MNRIWRNVLVMSFFGVVVSACDVGSQFYAKDVRVRVKVTIERQMAENEDVSQVIYAMALDQREVGGKTVLTFQCPCYVGDLSGRVYLGIEGELFKVSLLPGAPYNITSEIPTVSDP